MITGTAEAGSTVTLFKGSTNLGSTVATDGTWSITSSQKLADGSHTIRAVSVDSLGNPEATANIKITVEEEVFFNTPVAGIQQRSAIGYSNDGFLIMMVVDGRQADSRGVYLEELAIMMMEFNCDEAINLDGGGSSCMVADNRLLNRPVGRNTQREIMSAIGVFYGNQ